jgi:hypothetical protein
MALWAALPRGVVKYRVLSAFRTRGRGDLPQGVGDGDGEPDAAPDPDADGDALSEGVASSVGSAEADGTGIEGSGSSVGSGMSRDGMPAMESTMTSTKIPATVRSHGFASRSSRVGRAPR